MKKLFRLVLVLYLLIGLVTFSAAAEVIDSGSMNDNITWTLDDSGILTISGEGKMIEDGPRVLPPWDAHKANIQEAVIEEGITRISMNAFHSHTALTKVSFP